MSDFPERLREEIVASQERRSHLVAQKFTFVIGAFGLGTLTTDAVKTWSLLFLAPIIALAFDLYTVGENFGIRRIGAFLGSELSSATVEEKRWEAFVARHRDPFSAFGGPFLSVIVLVASMILLFENHGQAIYYWAWLLLSCVMLAMVWWLSRRRNAQLDVMRHTLEHPGALRIAAVEPEAGSVDGAD